MLLNFNAFRSSSAAADAVIVNIPNGYRSSFNVYSQAWGQSGATQPTPCYYDVSADQVKTGIAIASGGSIAFTMVWPLEGAS